MRFLGGGLRTYLAYLGAASDTRTFINRDGRWSTLIGRNVRNRGPTWTKLDQRKTNEIQRQMPTLELSIVCELAQP
jgi:hypothetical protein